MATRARLVGFNHVALEVGDLDEALEFYGRLFESSQAISPAGIVELVTFVSVLQMLHRLSSFYPTTDFARAESA